MDFLSPQTNLIFPEKKKDKDTVKLPRSILVKIRRAAIAISRRNFGWFKERVFVLLSRWVLIQYFLGMNRYNFTITFSRTLKR